MTLRAEFGRFIDRQLVAYWNILQKSKRVFGELKDCNHEDILNELMNERAIAHESGKLTGYRGGTAVILTR